MQNLGKPFFKFAPKRWSKGLQEKKLVFLGKKQSTSILVQTFWWILQQISSFLAFFSKNIEYGDFNQCLECTAPKRCSKDTTYGLSVLKQL